MSDTTSLIRYVIDGEILLRLIAQTAPENATLSNFAGSLLGAMCHELKNRMDIPETEEEFIEQLLQVRAAILQSSQSTHH